MPYLMARGLNKDKTRPVETTAVVLYSLEMACSDVDSDAFVLLGCGGSTVSERVKFTPGTETPVIGLAMYIAIPRLAPVAKSARIAPIIKHQTPRV